LCKPFNNKGLRQPSQALNPKSLQTLMTLLRDAEDFIMPLRFVAEAACTAIGSQGHEIQMAPPKRWFRALQKAQEDYGGDYTRIVDLVRCTLVFNTVSQIVAALHWFSADAKLGKPGKFMSFEMTRVKDRLSQEWDPEMSGGNRNILINGRLTLPDGRWHMVEIQLHLAFFLGMTTNVDAIYGALRVLGAFDSVVTTHTGHLTDEVLARAEQGTLRKLRCAFTPMAVDHPGRVQRLLAQHKPCECPLLELMLSKAEVEGKPAFDGWELSTLLGPMPLACRRLRQIHMGQVGLQGSIPNSLFTNCTQLQMLKMYSNRLVGQIPEAVGSCIQLRELLLFYNQLTGPIPATISGCTQLRKLSLHHNQLTGQIPETIANCVQLEELALDSNQLSGVVPAAALARLTNLTLIALNENPNLIITDVGQAQLQQATPRREFRWSTASC